MVAALVGSLGTVATGSGSASPAFAQSTTAGNLLIAWAAMPENLGQPSTPAGWSVAAYGNNNTACLFYKANCSAGETAPTITSSGGAVYAALAEFSGCSYSSLPKDQTNVANNNVSPLALSMIAPDIAASELVVSCAADLLSKSGTATTSDTYASNATALNVGNNDATSTLAHYRLSYAITTNNSVADSITHTNSSMNLSMIDVSLVSFKLLGASFVFNDRPIRRNILLRR